MTTVREEMCMELHYMRRLVMDMPDHQIPDVYRMIFQLEERMRELCGDKGRKTSTLAAL